ncbi:MAG: hypothetical protein QM736_03640 [Vicinamibacterales bacterium]
MPAFGYSRRGFRPVAVPPSLKVHAYVSVSPSGSLEPDALKVTVAPASPL